jgi:hypothetical protein
LKNNAGREVNGMKRCPNPNCDSALTRQSGFVVLLMDRMLGLKMRRSFLKKGMALKMLSLLGKIYTMF